MGFSGAGKSTLARCINHLETPDAGDVLIDGVDITSLDAASLRAERQKVAMIFQNFNLFSSKTVYGNIAYPLRIVGTKKDEVDARVREAASFVGLGDKLPAYPGGLSGGQKQRVGIARAIISKPDVLLSDEATSALDPQTTIQILDLLKRINRETGITIVMITHELDAIRYTCHNMAVLEEGKVIEQGAVDEIFSNPRSRTGALFAKVFRSLQSVPVRAEAMRGPVVERRHQDPSAREARGTLEAVGA
ncbi:MAG: ATP-binding cassette domain-containing protein [Atopobiaceae bacterium]|nr:ATP-binding cassette domain-containing protein [Atopobiaceae bacterium]MCH4180311.1 ATP-binding cassette domain-containing protein [Atopobiaceae bacterium]MCH4214879.1 ATP-binding cassette domain-containing protein [Atopobiaceae bacterium]MCH4229316.1 ATP-binding cassette domain-containing protein [Atopobiaceae bacterium]MCH4276371.1 ATP-binding cassette domain-containing protein [Atopobiaceae bacterium]